MKTKTTKYVVQFQDEKGIFQDDLEHDSKKSANEDFKVFRELHPATRIIKRTVTIDEVIVS